MDVVVHCARIRHNAHMPQIIRALAPRPLWVASVGFAGGLALLAWFLSRGRLFDRDLIADIVAAYNAGDLKDARRMALLPGLAGNPQAQYLLGMIDQAEPGKHDRAESLMWYRRASSAGYVPAEVALGREYLTASPNLALPWLLKAARSSASTRGLSRETMAASLLIAKMYDDGIGVAKNPNEALRWYFTAAEKGSPAACERIAGLRSGRLETDGRLEIPKCRALSKRRAAQAKAPE